MTTATRLLHNIICILDRGEGVGKRRRFGPQRSIFSPWTLSAFGPAPSCFTLFCRRYSNIRGIISRVRFSQLPLPPSGRLLIIIFSPFIFRFLYLSLSLFRFADPLLRVCRRSTSNCRKEAPLKRPRKPWRRRTRGSVSSPCSREQPCRTRDTSEEGTTAVLLFL